MVIFGMVFVGIIMICILSAVISFFLGAYNNSDGKNNKLMENIKKLDERNK